MSGSDTGLGEKGKEGAEDGLSSKGGRRCSGETTGAELGRVGAREAPEEPRGTQGAGRWGSGRWGSG